MLLCYSLIIFWHHLLCIHLTNLNVLIITQILPVFWQKKTAFFSDFQYKIF